METASVAFLILAVMLSKKRNDDGLYPVYIRVKYDSMVSPSGESTFPGAAIKFALIFPSFYLEEK
jgi:hypothetical protein